MRASNSGIHRTLPSFCRLYNDLDEPALFHWEGKKISSVWSPIQSNVRRKCLILHYNTLFSYLAVHWTYLPFFFMKKHMPFLEDHPSKSHPWRVESRGGKKSQPLVTVSVLKWSHAILHFICRGRQNLALEIMFFLCFKWRLIFIIEICVLITKLILRLKISKSLISKEFFLTCLNHNL